MRHLAILLSRSIPFYTWMGLSYGIFVLVIALAYSSGAASPEDVVSAAASDSCLIEGEKLYQRVEAALDCRVATIPLFSENQFAITWTILFIAFGFVSSWIEVVRATAVRDTARNDTWSLVITIVAFVLFVGVSAFGTTAFMIVALVGFGDVLLDRYVGQAVARRDFGGMIHPGGQ